MFKFNLKYFLLSCILLHYCITVVLAQGAYNTGADSLDDPPPIFTCNGTDLYVRTYDGTCTNLKHNNWGTPNRVYDRGFFPAYYQDPFSGTQVTNLDCRKISNAIGDNGLPPSFTGNPLGDDILSTTRKNMFEIFFGQFINHDLENAALQGDTPQFAIADLTNDYLFNNNPGNIWNPNGTQYMMITLSLGRVLNSTLYPANLATSYLDLSTIYGNNVNDASTLRTNADGMLVTSNYQTNGGIYNAKIGKMTVENMAPSALDSSIAPSLNVPEISVNDAMVGGDARASENVQLAIMHTIWVREHNYQAKQAAKNPKLVGNDEAIYQQARKITIAEYQRIVYEEFLPAALGFQMPAYGGYNENVYADTSAVFAAAAFRYGHSQVRPYNIIDGCTEELITLHPDQPINGDNPNRFNFVGRAISLSPPAGSLLTHDQIDYTPARMIALASGTSGKGVDNIVVSMLRESAANFDTIITAPLRNMPAVIDLFATDIARGRLAGLQPYNVYRAYYHPAGDLYTNPVCGATVKLAEDSLECFSLITSNQTLAVNLKSFYGKVSLIDAIVGMFAEDKLGPTYPLPPTITNIIKDEFEKKRYGDRFWYEGDALTDAEKTAIKAVTMKTIIERNTNVINVQVNSFKTPGVNDPLPVLGKFCTGGAAKGAKLKGKAAPAAAAAPAAPAAPVAKGAK